MPIGRLDLESKGLLLFTQNGKLGDMLTRPGNCIKEYEIWVRGYVTNEHIQIAKRGVQSIHGLLKVLDVQKISIGGAKTKLRVKIDEGKNRYIRRLFGALKVLNLNRISIGTFNLNISSGKWRYLTVNEEKNLIKDL